MKNIITEHRDVEILSTGVRLEGAMSIPEDAKGIVLFVHGSGSSRHSPRNRHVAQTLQEGGLATLLFDLLTPAEEAIDQHTRQWRFDISLLARRTAAVLEWLELQPSVYNLRRGLFGSSTGAAAALMAAAELPEQVEAIVSRGGRPDLAGEALPKVQAPTLLIVGGLDEVVIDLNEKALAWMQSGSEKKLVLVPGASHLFEEAGTLEYAAQLARDWFQAHLSKVSVEQKKYIT
jgi:pimeloyl-ACP methyl ester carboxylesterase